MGSERSPLILCRHLDLSIRDTLTIVEDTNTSVLKCHGSRSTGTLFDEDLVLLQSAVFVE